MSHPSSTPADRPSGRSAGRLSRRSLLTGAGALGVLGGLGALSACGSDDSTATGPAAGGSSAGTSAAGGFPATVQTKFGAVTIDSAPERIVCLGYTDADYALALGVVPVGVTQWIPQWKQGVGSWATDRLGGTTPALFTPPWDFEKIASLAPDVIFNIGSDGSEADYKKLTAIAPTIDPPSGAGAYGTPWDQTMTMIGTGLGQQAKAEQIVAQTRALIAKDAEENPSFAGKTVSVIAPYQGQVGVYHSSDTRMQLMRGLGLKANAYVEGLGTKDFYSSVSNEQVDRLDADVVIAFPDTGQTRADLLEAVPGLASLQATKNGALITISELEPSMAFSGGTVLSIPLALQTVVPPMQKALA